MIRKNIIKKVLVSISIIPLVIFSGCFDQPNEFVSPQWNVELNIPVTSKSYELAEIVEKDSSLLKSFQDPDRLGLIYFGDTQKVTTITVDDELKMDPFETRFSQTIGVINLSVPYPAGTEIMVEDWTTDVSNGSYQVFPEQEGNIQVDVDGIKSVEYLTAQSGKLKLYFYNNLPVPLTLRGMQIRNKDDLTVIADTANSVSEWITIARYDSVQLNFPISNVRISNTLEYIGTMHSPGSGSDSVFVVDGAGTIIIALFEDLVVSAARAQLPIQQFNFQNSLFIDDSTKIEEAIIESGKINMVVNNHMDLDLNAQIDFDNLFDDNDNSYSLTIPLNRGEKNKVIEIPSLAEWRIATATPGVPTGELSYNVNIYADSSGVISTITKDDSISFDLTFDEIVFKEFSGQLKPTSVLLDETGFKMDYGTIQNNLGFGEINFEGATFNLNLNSSMNFETEINGILTSTNGIQTNQMNLSNITLPATEPIAIDISQLVNGFSQVLPDSFAMQGSASLNPSYGMVSVVRGDSVYGDIDFEIPLNVGIGAGTYKDTLEVNMDDIDEEEIEKFNKGEITFTITNSIPVGLTVTAEILDSNYVSVATIPSPDVNEKTYLEVPKPDVSDGGDIMLPAVVEQTLVLNTDDIQSFLRNPYLGINVEFATSGESSTPVKFLTTHSISFSIKGSAEYNADFN